MSDVDDLPELVSTDDSAEEEEVVKQNGEKDDDDNAEEAEAVRQNEEHAIEWLRRDARVRERQETWFRVFCLGPYLYGVDQILPISWIKALTSADLITLDRQKAITYLKWPEWDCLDLMDQVVRHVNVKMRDQLMLAHALRCVQMVDDCITGQSDDVDRAISCATQVVQVTNLWTSLLKHELSWEKSNKERATKFAVLYAIKIYSEHVLKFDFVDGTKKILKKTITGKSADELKREGNSFFKNTQLEDSIKCYTEAAKKDPFHHVYYGNRAQAYNKLLQYKEALADGRRAVTIRPDFAKGYYRYAVAFHELGRLDSAISVIENGIAECQKVKDIDVSNLNELRSLEQAYAKQRIERNSKHVLTPLPKDLDEQLAAYPTNPFNNVDLETKFGTKKPTLDRSEDDVPPMVSSDSEPETIPIKKHGETIVNGLDKPSKKAEINKGMDRERKLNKEEERLRKFEERKREEEAKKAEAEERKKKEEAERKRRREEEVREVSFYVSEGSELMLQRVGKRAMGSYQKALDMLAHHNNIEDVDMDESDLVTLKYAYGMAAISTGLHKNIVDAVEKFLEILELHQEVRFPPAYYGLAMAYVTLNRFPEALDYVKNGLKVASNIRYVTVTWPGSKTLLDESDQTTLLGRLEDLLQQCKFPPHPDAVCRRHTDELDSRTVIYLSDPDFKGYVKIMCQMDCIITFHTICWKTYKTEINKQTDKDMLDTDCPTPDCEGVIIKIEIIRQDSLSNKEHISERYTELKEAHRNKPRPSTKQKPGEAKQARKHEKKEVRKQKKQRHLVEDRHFAADEAEHKGETTEHAKKSGGIQDGASAMAFIDELRTEDGPQTMPDMKDTVAYKKEEPVYKEKSAGKVKKSKKKKEKTKQIINLEVNFSDRKEETLGNENSAIIDGNNANTSGGAPFSVPSDLQSQISTFEKSYSGTSKPIFKPDEVTENLFSFFVDILTASGPLAIDDQKIQQELDVFPVEALEKIRSVGGLADFLRQSLKFAVIDDVVSLMSDAKQAREYAIKRRNKHSKEGGPPVTQSAWQTVGKNTGSVDSLSESVKSKTSAGAPVVPQSSVNTKPPSKETGLTRSSPPFPSSNLPNTPQPTLPTMQQNGVATMPNKSVTTMPQESVPTMPKQPARAWSSFVKPPGDSLSGEQRSPGIDALDSIEDSPVQKQSSSVSKQINDLDDFDYSQSHLDHQSVSGTEYRKPRAETSSRSNSKHREEDVLSNSSSRSDLSDKSLRSDFSTDQMPKPLRPLGMLGVAKGGVSAGRGSGMWDKLESDFDSSWGRTRQEEYTEGSAPSPAPGLADSVADEVRQAADDFVRKSDEKFVSELAQSVVNKLYTGKKVSVDEKQKTLKNVSSEIWKDFEKSASSGTTFGGNIWANTPAGAAYSANMGKFANDFMKKHYESLEDGLSSDQKTFYSKPISPLDTFNSTKNSSGFSSPISPPSTNTASPALASQPLPLVVPPAPTSGTPTSGGLPSMPSYSGGYNLFSGPSWGLDSFNKPNMAGNHPNYNQPPPPLFIRPPHPATSYYQSPPVSLRPEAPSFQPPFPTSLQHPPIQPQPAQAKVEKRDMDIQCSVQCVSVETMTEPYEPFKAEYMKMREERDQALKLMMDTKAVYERLVQQCKAKEQQIKLVESQLSEEIHKCAVEKKRGMEEREVLTGDIHQLQDRLNKQAHAEKELREKMSAQEQRVNEIARLAKEQREKDLGEIKRYKEVSDGVQMKYNEQMERARSAEIDILKSHLATDKTRMTRTQKESSFHEQHLATFIKKHQEENKPVPPQLQGSYDYWHSVQTKIEESIKKIQAEYESRIEEVRGGRLLSDIQPVRIPSPPPIPDYVRSALKSMMGQQPPQGMPGFMVPRLPGPGGASSAGQMSPLNAPISSFPALPSSAPTPLPSRPQADLRPVTTVATPSQVLPRPLSGARAPLTTAMRAPLKPLGGGTAAGQAGQMSSFEKLMQKLHGLYPKYSRSDFTGMIQELRTECGGSLSGMTMDDIVGKIGERVSRPAPKPTTKQTKLAHKPAAPSQPAHPPGLSPSWAFPRGSGPAVGVSPARSGGSGGGEVFEDEEDPCVICHEEMEPAGKTMVTLECNHTFHDECIRKWFQEQSTCPNCRVHTLLADEFPSLG